MRAVLIVHAKEKPLFRSTHTEPQQYWIQITAAAREPESFRTFYNAHFLCFPISQFNRAPADALFFSLDPYFVSVAVYRHSLIMSATVATASANLIGKLHSLPTTSSRSLKRIVFKSNDSRPQFLGFIWQPQTQQFDKLGTQSILQRSSSTSIKQPSIL